MQKKLYKFESWNAGCKQWWILGTEKASEIGSWFWSRHMLDLQASPNSDVGRAGSECYTWSPILLRSKLIFFFFFNTTSYMAHISLTYGCFKMGIKFSSVTEHWGRIQKLRRSLLDILGQVASSFASTQTTTNSYTHIHSSDSPCAVTPTAFNSCAYHLSLPASSLTLFSLFSTNTILNSDPEFPLRMSKAEL